MMQTDALDTSWFKPIGSDDLLPTIATPSPHMPSALTSRFRYRETEERIAAAKQERKTAAALKEAFAPKPKSFWRG